MGRFVRRSLATVSVLTLLMGACSGDETVGRSTVVSGLRSADGVLDATLVIESDWGSGYRAKVNLTSTSSTPTTAWSLVIALNGGQMTSIDAPDSATPRTPTSGPVTVRDVGWNSRVSSSQSQSFGFNGAGSGRPTLTSVSQTGATGGGGTSGSGNTSGTGNTGNAGGTGNTGNVGGGGSGGSGGTTGTGTITRQVWNNVQGTAVSQIPVNNAPSSTGTLSSFEAPSDVGDNYGQRVRGFLVAPATGSYTFWIAGDDNVELWLSTDANAANRRRIAFHTSWTGRREWNKFASQKSAAIQLTAGTRYYIEALMKEGSGGDNLAVGWARPNQSTSNPSEVIPGSVLAPFSDSTGSGGAGGTSGGGGTGNTGNTGGGGTSGTSGSGGSSGAGTCGGYATRFWDCCKPHCGWPGNVPSGMNPMNSCSLSGTQVVSSNTQSACGGGSAYQCYGMAPWQVSPTLSYGFAATSNGDICGRCFQLDFAGSSFNAGNDVGSQMLAGKRMIVQAINVGFDVGNGQFDLLIPGGGVGQFNACSQQWGVSSSELGPQYGGFLAACKQQGGSFDQQKACVSQRCTSVFANRGLNDLAAGCRWFVDWFQIADNPRLTYKEVTCPAEIMNRSGMNRTSRNDVSNSCR